MRPRRSLQALAVAAVVGSLPAVASAAPASLEPVAKGGASFVPGEAIVRFEPGTGSAQRLAVRRAADVGFERSLELSQAQVVEVDGGVGAAVERLERQPGVAYAQPNYRYRALAVPAPGDSFFGDLWGLRNTGQFGGVPGTDVNALEAWETTRGEGQVVAVVDTGVDLTHPDLVGNLWTGPGGVHGHDFVDNDSNPDDFDYHGTHVAGTIAATDDNGLGIAGVAPDAQIMAVRVLDGDGSGSSSDIADGIEYAGDQGADVVNLSLGGPAGGSGDQVMEDAIAAAAADGTVVVAAAGNSADDNDDPEEASTPCALPNANLICVAAVTPSGGLASFSSYGATTVDVGAPGTTILSSKADYDAVLTDGFDDADLAGWDKETLTMGSIPWGAWAISPWAGTHSAADSPTGNYAPNSNSQLIKAAAVDLTGERGCRMHFRLRRDIQPQASNGAYTDRFVAGAVTTDVDVQTSKSFAGSSGGSFLSTEISISDLGGRADVYPAFALFSNGSDQRDGAYVDDLQLLCRSATYADSKAASGNYVFFQGTSMATPHVAGVVALARAAALEAGEPADVASTVAAIRAGVTPLPSLAGKTSTGGMVDAQLAIERMLDPDLDPGPSSDPDPDPDPDPDTDPGAGSVPSNGNGKTGKATVSLRAPKVRLGPAGRVRARRARWFAYRVRATPGTSGTAVIRIRGRVPVGSGPSRRPTLARIRFTVPADGELWLVPRLSRSRMRLLVESGRLPLSVSATVRNAGGKKASATRRLLLLPPLRP